LIFDVETRSIAIEPPSVRERSTVRLHQQQFPRIFLFVATALEFCAGCGGRDPRIPLLAQATGVVLYKSEPLSGATILFASDLQDKGYHPGVARTNDEGEFQIRTYNLDGAVVGSHKVSVVALDHDLGVVAPATGTNSRWKPPVSLIPAKYGDPEKSRLTAEVMSGVANRFDFELDDE
jgi:hypothetical protein